MADYDLASISLPKLQGRLLAVAARALDNRAARALFLERLLAQGGVDKIRGWRLSEPPTMFPEAMRRIVREPDPPLDVDAFAVDTAGPFRSISDYAAAYRRGEVTPDDVAARFLVAAVAADAGELPLRAFIAIDRDDVVRQAAASTRRFAEGAPLGLLDGVPIAIKDEVDMVPYPTTGGTRFLGKQLVAEDSEVVARLRATGAVLVGKANMHEIGINPTGLNVHHGVTRNPYALAHDPGGSSSGSAAAVAAGLVPAAIGADGGGSIRIPAALCGGFGLKPTFGRVSERGAVPICWSVAHLGPIAATAADAALIYAAIAGPDLREPHSLHQPLVTMDDWPSTDLSGVRFGVYPEWFEHAADDVVAANRSMLDKLVARGARLIEVAVPELEQMRVAHAVTILSEMAGSMASWPEHQSELGAATRISLALGRAFTSGDYVRAQRMRTRAMNILAGVFEQVDAVITPATAIAAPAIPDKAMPHGWSDLSTVTELMRYVVPGNLCGNPAISFPVGYTADGLPIAMQAMSDHWREPLLLRIARAAEQELERKLPPHWNDLLASG